MANKLDLAKMQFIGYHHGSRGYSIKELASSMGLTKKEWLEIREEYFISDSEREEVDQLFKTLKSKK